jgi:hypothetical protein
MGKEKITVIEKSGLTYSKGSKSGRLTKSSDDLFVKLDVFGEIDKKAQLIVPEGSKAIIMKDGVALETLSNGRYAVFEKSKEWAFNKILSVQIIYLQTNKPVSMRWGFGNMDMRDPVTDIPITIGANGEVIITIDDARKFFEKTVGNDRNTFSTEDFQQEILSRIKARLTPILAKAMRELNLTYYSISEHLLEISDAMLVPIRELLREKCGVATEEFVLDGIMVPPSAKAAIEAELNARKAEKKQQDEEARQTAVERDRIRFEIEQLERREDRQWAMQKYLEELRSKDTAAYLEACKIVGWDKDTVENIVLVNGQPIPTKDKD